MNTPLRYTLKWSTGLATLFFGLSAHAALTNCADFGTPDITGRLVANVGCQVSTETQDFIGGGTYTVNQEQFFTFDDWLTAGKQNLGGSFETGDVDIGFGTGAGTWSLGSDAWTDYSDIMLIFKSGNNGLVGYLLQPGELSGTWDNPFTDPPFSLPGQSTEQGISHITAYARGSVEVPEPGSLALLGLGLLGLAGARRRLRR